MSMSPLRVGRSTSGTTLVALIGLASQWPIMVRADLPVHCVQPEVVGLWRFHIGRYATPGGDDPRCGFTSPDPPDGHHQLTPPATSQEPAAGNYYLTDNFKKSHSLDLLLRDWTAQVVVSPGGNSSSASGEWTMIYDEGFHVSLVGDTGAATDAAGASPVMHSFLAFSKYMRNGDEASNITATNANKKHSYCGYTLLGWYKQFDVATGALRSEQCFWGERLESLHEALGHLPPALATPIPVAPQPEQGAKQSQLRQRLPTSALQPQVPPDGGGTPLQRVLTGAPMKRALQLLCPALGTLAAVAVCLAVRDKKSRDAGSLEGLGKPPDQPPPLWPPWRAVAVVLAVLALFAGAAWLWQRAAFVAAAASPAAVFPEAGPRRRTIASAADAVHEAVERHRRSGGKVLYSTSAEKLKTWAREWSAKHSLGLDIHDPSSVERLLDAIAPPLRVGVLGFTTEQSIGPARAKAIEEQERLAATLGKGPADLGVEDLREHWRPNAADGDGEGSVATSVHEQRRFTLGGKDLAEDGWRTLKAFDWREVALELPNSGGTITNFVNAVTDQGGCGSCYAVAATSMLTSRLMLKYPELHETFGASRGADRISVAQQLACNHYNQGCSGGYPYLTSKWSHEHDLVSHKCMEQTTAASGGGRDTHQCVSNFTGAACQERFRVSNWRYIGGALGRCGLHHLCEEAIREELYKGGPLAVSIEPTGGFGYEGGVFHGVPGLNDKNLMTEVHSASDVRDCGDTECFVWRKVDHSVLLVGWGEDESQGLSCQPRVHRTVETNSSLGPEPHCERLVSAEACQEQPECVYRGFPYWIIQNSYGKSYGRQGYLYFGPRGQDPMRVESMALAADVEWVNPPALGRRPGTAAPIVADDREAASSRLGSARGEVHSAALAPDSDSV